MACSECKEAAWLRQPDTILNTLNEINWQINSMHRIARSLGAAVYYEDNLGMDGVWCPGLPGSLGIIMINAGLEEDRRDFILAHEIAHMLLAKRVQCACVPKCKTLEITANQIARHIHARCTLPTHKRPFSSLSLSL